MLQTVADALKLFQKEDIIPSGADRWLFTIAPALVFIPAYLVYVVIPFGKGLTPHSLNVGIIYMIAISSIGVIGIVVAGWASNNKWSLLGAFRGASQLIAYEVPIILAVSIPVLMTGSLDLDKIVSVQSGGLEYIQRLDNGSACVLDAADCWVGGDQRHAFRYHGS
jgi:NADH-quinone oxidoreductase subunit H